MWGIALEGGGARCAAQAGVLAALWEQGLAPQALAACGAGAWVAALYGLGLRKEGLERLVRDVGQAGNWMLDGRRRGFRMWVTGRGPGLGLYGMGRVQRMLRWQTLDARMTDIEMPLALVCREVETGRVHGLSSVRPERMPPMLWSRQAGLAQGACASMALPGLFAPVEWQGHRLVGGASLWPYLQGALLAMGATRTLYIRVFSEEDRKGDLPSLILADRLPSNEAGRAVLRVPLPSQAEMLDFCWMEQHYEMGYRTVLQELPRLRALMKGDQGKLLPFPR